ncbi:MAG TPA: ribonuclease HII [Candidatus Limnocylindrales bacterium]|nr:ribonuclease HII [Candidatus Limnocylindrales bacterium]
MSASSLPTHNNSSADKPTAPVQIQMAMARMTTPEGLLECGVDEVGIGSAIAEVYAAACILNPARRINGLRDSKQLTPERRKELSERIKDRALDFCIATASLEEVNTLNVFRATMLAMQRAVAGLKLKPGIILIDGNRMPSLPYPARTIIKGDAKVRCISAASILAKVARDEAMLTYHEQFPQYGIDRHKGYLTALHQATLKQFGPCAIHRKNYEPVRALLSPAGSEQLSLIAEDPDELERIMEETSTQLPPNPGGP